MIGLKKKEMFLSKIIFKENKKSSEEKIIISSDFETITKDNKLYVYSIGLLYNEKNYYEFLINFNEELEIESKKLIKKYILFLLNKFKKNEKVYVYFHNLGFFDGYFLMQYFIEFHINEIKCLIKDSKIYYIKYKNITFLDSYNIVPYSLNEIGKIFFDSEKTLNINEYNSIELVRKNLVKIRKYLYHDVLILYKMITSFRKKFLLENIDITKKITISSIAFYIYRMRFMSDIKIRTTRFNNFLFLKKGYQGGINHVCIPVMTNGYYYDINSLYPYVMKTCEMPLGDFNIIINNFKDISNYFGFIYCSVYVNKDIKIHPLLVKIGKRENIQATGILTGVWFSEEIKYGLTLGIKIIEIYKIYSFEEKKVIFSEYVDFFYTKRIESDNKIDNTLYKLLLNSLYGKFGMNLNYNEIKKITKENLYSHELTHVFLNKFSDELYNIKVDYDLYSLTNKYLEQIKESDEKEKIKKILKLQKNKFSTSNVCVHIAAAISSYARIKLVKDINDLIKLHEHEIYYYDTDCIFTNKRLPEKMISDNELGKYKLVDEIKKAYFLACKVYTYINKEDKEVIKFKGLKKEEKKNKLNFEIYENIYISMKEIEEKKINVLEYTFNTLKKNLTDFSIYEKEFSFKPIFNSNKYINIYDSKNSWVATKLLHKINYFFIIKNIFLFFKYVLNKSEYYKLIYNFF